MAYYKTMYIQTELVVAEITLLQIYFLFAVDVHYWRSVLTISRSATLEQTLTV